MSMMKYLGSSSEHIFMYINAVLVVFCVFSIEGIIDFRSLCSQQGYYVFQISSLPWLLLGFFTHYICKYSYLKYMHQHIENILAVKKQNDDDREYRLKSLKKLSFDSIQYVIITGWAYYLFQNESWYPSVAGGIGQCSNLYNSYPDWPKDSSVIQNMQMYTMVQFGIHIFKIYELLFIYGPNSRKFFQWLLHHFVAVILILFSLFSNQITAGIVILIIHDASDIFSSLGRGYMQTKFTNTIGLVIGFLAILISWVYLRTIVYPLCVVKQIYNNIPGPNDDWHVIKFQYIFTFVMTTVLLGMHVFWIYYLVLFGIKKVKKDNVENTHESATKKIT